MNKSVEKLVQRFINQDWQYGMKVIKITGYDIDEKRERIHIHTNEKESHFDRPLDEVQGLLSQLKPIREISKVEQADSLLATASGADQLKDILMDNIKKVQEDPKYIKQATAINNNVNSIISITKMQLDYAKAVNRMQANKA